MRDQVERSIVEVKVDERTRQVDAHLCFAAGLEVFAGHFPGLPLVPGIFLVEASRMLAERAVGVPLELREVREARFTGEVHPGDPVTACAVLEDRAGAWHCDTHFSTEQGKAGRVKLLLAVVDE